MPVPAGYVRKHFGLHPDRDTAFKNLISKLVEERKKPMDQGDMITEMMEYFPGYLDEVAKVEDEKRKQEQQ